MSIIHWNILDSRGPELHHADPGQEITAAHPRCLSTWPWRWRRLARRHRRRPGDGRRGNRPDHPAAAAHATRPAQLAGQLTQPGNRQEGAATMLTTTYHTRHGGQPGTPARAAAAAAAGPVRPDAAGRRLVAPVGRPGRRAARADPGHRRTARSGHPDHARLSGWDASAGRLRVDGPAGSHTVRLGWYETMPAGLLTATARAGRTDLLTVPPQTSEAAAWAAMDQAAQAGNRTHAPALLAGITTAISHAHPAARIPATRAPDDIEVSTWEWEGGHDSARREPLAGPPGPGITSSARAGGADRSTRVSADSASSPQ